MRETEGCEARLYGDPAAPVPSPRRPHPRDVHTRAAEDKLRLLLGTRVRITRRRRGRIEIDFISEKELIRIYESLTGDDADATNEE